MGEKPALIGSAVASGLTRFFKIFCFLFHRLEKEKARPARGQNVISNLLPEMQVKKSKLEI